MKYCPNCGAEIKEGADVCLGCGKRLNEASSVQNTQANNSMAVAGFVTGLISLFLNFWGIVGLVATILSAVGLSQIRKTNAKGKGLAIVGLILGIFSILYGVFVIIQIANLF